MHCNDEHVSGTQQDRLNVSRASVGAAPKQPCGTSFASVSCAATAGVQSTVYWSLSMCIPSKDALPTLQSVHLHALPLADDQPWGRPAVGDLQGGAMVRQVSTCDRAVHVERTISECRQIPRSFPASAHNRRRARLASVCRRWRAVTSTHAADVWHTLPSTSPRMA